MRPSFSWADVEPEEHAVQFAVAKAMQVDVLQTIQTAMQKAIDEGIPYAQFAKDLKPQLRRRGWWGVKEQVDPATGEARKVQLGSPRRLKTIYRSNMRSARAAGQWDRVQRTKRALPYLVYQLGPSERHRPAHEAKAGLVLPVDDPFWRTWYPPNGWGCKCHVRQITKREADRRGGVSDSPPIPMRDVLNHRTGEIKTMPSGIDPGWETNPGMVRQRVVERLLSDKLNAADPMIARVASRDMAASWRTQRLHDGTAKGTVPLAVMPDDLVNALGSQSRVVLYSDETAAKMRGKHRDTTAQDLTRLDDLLHNGRAIQGHSKNSVVVIQEHEGHNWVAVVKVTSLGDELYLSTFYKASARYVKRLTEEYEGVR